MILSRRPPGPVSFSRSACGPPVKLDARIGTETQVKGTQEAAGSTGGPGAAATLALAARGLDALGGRGSPMIPELALEAVKLLHEVEVWRYVGLAAAYQVESVVQIQAALVHQVGHGYRHRARYTGQTVHQHALVRISGFLCKLKNK